MSPQLASILYGGCIFWLFRADVKWRNTSSHALWLPAIWLTIIGSRPLGTWLGGGVSTSAVDGNPINLLTDGCLMFAALVTLQRRGFDWQMFLRDNKALMALYLYFAISAAWSHYPLASFKRICRDYGTVLMALVILTETDPWAMARLLFVRVSFLLLPLSVLLIKYFPQYGRMYAKNWEPMWTGVTPHKNALGLMVLTLGLWLIYDIMELHHSNAVRNRKQALANHYLLLLIGAWLLVTCDSKTSLASAIVGGIVLWASRYLGKLNNLGPIAVTCVAVVLALFSINATFDLSDDLIHALGRQENLTGRTEVWDWVLKQPINPIIGYGYNTFWDGPLGQGYNERTDQLFSNSQNGYLDVYIDGGMMGALLLAWLLTSCGIRSLESLRGGSLFGRAMVTFFTVALVHDYAETSFFRLDLLWFMLVFTIIASAYHGQSVASLETAGHEELAFARAP